MATMSETNTDHVVLQIDGISKSFPGVDALKNMTIDLRHAEVHAVCGENGAGKSTLMKIITGIYKPDRGTMTLNGKTLEVKNPNDAYARGIAIIFQETSLFPELTVLENIFMGHEITKAPVGHREALLHPRLSGHEEEGGADFRAAGDGVDLDVRVADLGVATKQMVEIAKALSFDSRILILDEPTAALTNKEVDTLFETIRKLKAPRRLDALHQSPPGRDLPDRGPRDGHPRRGAHPHGGRRRRSRKTSSSPGWWDGPSRTSIPRRPARSARWCSRPAASGRRAS